MHSILALARACPSSPPQTRNSINAPFVPVAYPAEKNYHVGNRELLAVKLALEEWLHWLEGAEHAFIVRIDNDQEVDRQSIKNIVYIEQLNPYQAWWAMFFRRFSFIPTYHPGSRNIKPDAFSLLPLKGRCQWLVAA